MSHYTAVHANPKGPGDARPTALKTIKDEGLEEKRQGQVFVITGTSSGIGIETVRAIATTGATLYLTARDLDKAKTALDGIFDPSPAATLKKTSKIHCLIANAGIMAIPDLRFTEDGHELQFGTNHLSHFLFLQLLKPALLAAASPDLPSQVVVLSSSSHNIHGINDSDNYSFGHGDYDPNVAYGQSKTANIYMANEIERRYDAQHLHATSVHPGVVATGLTRHMPPDAFKGMEYVYPMMKSVEQGATTTVWATVGEAWKHDGGKYLVDCDVARLAVDGDDKIVGPGYAPHAYDVEKAKRLWGDSNKLVGLEDEE
ncbi:WW domain-containing protein [Fusarium mundagurra]|uniref:WW domain-containing protein n=1 Tax=Fusarium mundagurra TaxID=1567541 RepID=A0A8H5YYD7_9HYPO|nr:WW domain-containing protein [Fusarium mundagurra]